MRFLLTPLLIALCGLLALPATAADGEAERALPGVIRMPRYAPATPQQLEANACHRRCADPLFTCTKKCRGEACREACLSTHEACAAACPAAPTPPAAPTAVPVAPADPG